MAQVEIFGERRYAIRIWLDRRAMAARNLTVADIEEALRRNNVELPAGELKSTTRQFTVRTESRLSRVEQFESIVVERVDGYPIRLADIARIERGVEDDESIVRSDNREAVGLGVLRQSQANTIAISNRVREQIELMRPNLPEGMEITIGSDDAVFIKESIHEVVRALGIAVVLVVLVIFAFLASARATAVPAITIPVAVIGAFIGIYALGFSINVLTLLALILAIGIVVDDAIVVLENIQRRVELGETPAGRRRARHAPGDLRGDRDLAHADRGVRADLVPRGPRRPAVHRVRLRARGRGRDLDAGRADPVPGAVHQGAQGREAGAPQPDCSSAASAPPRRGYRALLARCLDAPVLVLLLAALIGAASFGLYRVLPQELMPTEDRGVFFIPVTAPQGATVGYTDAEVREVEAIVQPLRASGEAERIFAIAGRRARRIRPSSSCGWPTGASARALSRRSCAR